MPAEVIAAEHRGVKGGYKKKSDIYPVGMIAFFILTKGKHPFGDYLHDRMTNILKGDPVYLDIVEDLEARDFITAVAK